MLKKIIVFILIAFILAFPLFFWMDWDVKKGKAAYTKSHPFTVTPLYSGDVRLYTTGNEFYEALFHDIEQAQRYIYIHFFIARNDEISKKLYNVLKQRAEKGVEVRLSVDLLGGHEITMDILKDLREHGVHFTYSRKTKLPHFFYSLHRRNHRRIAVIDGNISYIGGFNIGDEHLGKSKWLGYWRDYQIRITGNGAYEAQKRFLEDWKEDTGDTIAPKELTAPSGKVQHQYIYASGTGLEEHLAEWIRNAKSSIIIASPYFVPPQPLKDAMIDAIQRGVKIKMLVTKKTDAWFTQPPGYSALQALVEKGADIYEYEKGFFHGKIMIFDNKMLDIGTVNWDSRSIFINDESNCLIYDTGTATMVEKALQKDFANAKKMTDSYFRHLPFWIRILKHIPNRIVYYL